MASHDRLMRPEPTDSLLGTFCISAEAILTRASPALDSTLLSAGPASKGRRRLAGPEPQLRV